MFILSLIISVLLLLMLALIDFQSFDMFIDIQSFACILFFSLLFTCISIPPRKILDAFRNVLKKDVEKKPENYLILKEVFRVLGSMALLVGIFLTATFWVSLAQQAHELIAPGANLSLSFSLLFTAYGLLIKLVSYVIEKRFTYELENNNV